MTDLELMQRAKLYMDNLAQGIDPISGNEVSDDSLLNNVRLARCFFYVSGVLQQLIDNGGVVGSKPKKAEFALTAQQAAQLSPADRPLRITEFADMVLAAVGRAEMKRPNTKSITDWLLAKGFLAAQLGADGKTHRVPTEAGVKIGMYTELRQGQYGEYQAVYYAPSAQMFLLDHLTEILKLD